jgi:Flp pilus assembly protein TadG
MVEFALVAPMLFLLVFAVLQVGVAYMRYQQVGFAASEGARCGAVARTAPAKSPACAPTATSPASAAQSRAIAKAPALNLSASDVVVVAPSGWVSGGTVQVTVSKPWHVGILGFQKDVTLKATSTARLER